MKILLLGGTGAMGVHLVTLLSNENHEIVVTSRRSQVSEGKVKYIQGNAKDISFLQKILVDAWDIIVDFMVYTTKDFEERIHLLLNNTNQYVFLSSARVYADSNIIREDSPKLLEISNDSNYLESDEYALTKARQENILQLSGRKNWTVIRPYITYSENRLQLGVLEKEHWLYRAIKGRTIVFSRDMMSKVTTLTYGFDVANGITKVLGKDSAYGESFNIVMNTPITWKEVLSLYLDTLENHLKFRPKVLLCDLGEFLEIHAGRYQVLYDRLYNRRFDNNKISGYVNTSSFLEISKGLEMCLSKFLEDETFLKIDWKKEALKDRKTKEFTSLMEIPGMKKKIIYLLFRYINM